MGRWIDSIVVLALLGVASVASATDVSLVGLYSGKALIVVDGGRPQSVLVGAQTPEGVKLLSIENGSAQFQVDGRKQRLTVGQQAVSLAGDTSPAVVTLTADSSGHFRVVGTVNGVPTNFLVDTGATFVALGKADAIRANVDYQKGQPAMTMTANGPAQVWRVKLRSIRVGDVLLNDVDATVHDINLPVTLLGMSFLNHLEMKRDGATMTLKKRY